jgi:hypothetical protein
LVYFLTQLVNQLLTNQNEKEKKKTV